jgi:hypothetical protein
MARHNDINNAAQHTVPIDTLQLEIDINHADEGIGVAETVLGGLPECGGGFVTGEICALSVTAANAAGAIALGTAKGVSMAFE